MKLSCGICAGLRRRSTGGDTQPWDHVLQRSDNFAALPTRGAIVPGWVLVVSSQHILSMGAVEPHQRQELANFVSDVRARVEEAFGPTVVFEHGPAAPNLRVGCGVDHAHLHIVPVRFDILAGVPSVFPSGIAWREVAGLPDTEEPHRRNESYLFVQQHQTGCKIGTGPDLPSQLFRKVIANELGRAERFDWVAYPEPDNAWATVAALGVATGAATELALA